MKTTDCLDGRKKRTFLLILLLGCALFWGSSSPLHARSYAFTHLSIEAFIHLDGSMTVEEQRTVRFNGEFSEITQWINTGGRIEIRDLMVQEKNIPYTRRSLESNRAQRTYFVQETPRALTVTWNFRAKDETLTFLLRYQVFGAVISHQDVAELYWIFVGDKWDQGIDQVTIDLYLPEGASKEQLNAFGHGPLHGQVDIVSNTHIRFSVNRLGARTFVEGRVLFPTDLVPHIQEAYRRRTPARANILAEEALLAQTANRERRVTQANWVLLILLPLLALFFVLRNYLRYGREFATSFKGDYYREPPKDYSPAEMAVLFSMGQVQPKDFTATLLDLAQRGYLRLSSAIVTTKRGWKTREETAYEIHRTEKPRDGLKLHEASLLSFLFDTVAEKDASSLSFRQLEEFARKRKQTFESFWGRFRKEVLAESHKHGFFDETLKDTRKGQRKGSLLLFLLGLLSFYLMQVGLGLGLLLSALFMFMGACSLHRRSREGALDFAKWKAFEKFMLHFSEIQRQDVPALVLWEHYLVYAVALGIAKKVIAQLELLYPNLEHNGYQFGYHWYSYSALHQGSFTESFQSLTESIHQSIQTSIHTATASSSSESGSGGGFSGGGGGGAGGGGGSVR